MPPVAWGFLQSSHTMISSEAKVERTSLFPLLPGKWLLKTSKKEYNWQMSILDYNKNHRSWWNQNTFWNTTTTLKDRGALINGAAESIKKGDFHHHATNTSSNHTAFPDTEMYSSSKEETLSKFTLAHEPYGLKMRYFTLHIHTAVKIIELLFSSNCHTLLSQYRLELKSSTQVYG